MIPTLLDDKQFRILQSKALSLIGITLPESKRTMLINRLKPRMMVLQTRSIDDYISYLNKHESDEKQHFVNAITTTMSHFYREHHHYEIIIDKIKEREEETQQNFVYNIWSAGCSSGEEPYTMAMMLKHTELKNCIPKIVATDINTQMLVAAREGIYRWSDICDVPSDYISKYFRQFKNELGQDRYEVIDEVKAMINLRKLNLMKDFSFLEKFDVIMCRNVMIYFDEITRQKLLDRFVEMIKPGGLFVTGHSEIFDYHSKGLKAVGKTIYEKEKGV
jgi:chemotaxis protein methyltransferase CheR